MMWRPQWRHMRVEASHITDNSIIFQQLFGPLTDKTPKSRNTGPLWKESFYDLWFSSQRIHNKESASMSWRHHTELPDCIPNIMTVDTPLSILSPCHGD